MQKQHIYVFLTVLVMIMASCSKNDDSNVTPPNETIKSSDKQITSFVFNTADNDVLTETITATVNESNKAITATVPNGTDVTDFTPVIQVSDKASVSPIAGQDFTNSVTYTVTAEDGTKATYTTSVTVTPNDAKQILSFVFRVEDNAELAEDITTFIDEETKEISMLIPSHLTYSTLIPTIEVSEGATVDSTNSQSVIIIAEDGSIQSYNVNKITLVSPRSVLIELYKMNPENTLTWDITQQDISNWQGVTTNAEGNITELQLLTKNLSELPENFSFLNALEKLNLDFNNLTTLPIEFNRLDALTSLKIGGNRFTEIPEVIWEVESLTKLYLYNLELTTLPQEISQLTNLIVLHLNDNKITSLPTSLKDISTLRTLSIRNNNLITIPTEIFNIEKLDYLDLLENQITGIPSQIENLTELTVLRLGDNNIRIIPSEIAVLTKLKNLSLYNNDLVSISPGIGQLVNIELLYLNDNDLISIPSEIGNLTSLIILDLKNNELYNISQSICNLASLGIQLKLDDGVICL